MKWDFQDVAIERIRDAIRRQKKRILVVQPTGTGKGTIASKIAKLVHDKGGKSLFLVHVGEIVTNIAGRMVGYELNPSIIMPEHQVFDTSVYCGTVQSYHLRTKKNQIDLQGITVVQFDEAHRYNPIEGMYFEIAKVHANAVFIGYTATPIRADGTGLGDFFDEIIQVIDYKTAIETNVLVPPVYYAPFTPDLENAKTRGADFDEEYVEKVMLKTGITGDIVEHYSRHASERQGIVYATRRTHARQLCDEFIAAGYNTAYLDGETRKEERKEIIEGVYNKDIQILVNVGVLTEGFDAPSVEAIVLARPTKSLRYHIQTVGRGLRYAEYKKDCLILDHAGNTLRLGMVEEFNEWTLEKSRRKAVKAKPIEKPKEETILYTCESCGQEFYSSHICPACGWLLPRSTKKEEVSAFEGELAKIEGDVFKPEKALTPLEKEKWFAMLTFYGAQRNYSTSWASVMYRLRFKESAPFYRARGEPPNAEVIAFINKERRRSFAKGKLKRRRFDNSGNRSVS